MGSVGLSRPNATLVCLIVEDSDLAYPLARVRCGGMADRLDKRDHSGSCYIVLLAPDHVTLEPIDMKASNVAELTAPSLTEWM